MNENQIVPLAIEEASKQEEPSIKMQDYSYAGIIGLIVVTIPMILVIIFTTSIFDLTEIQNRAAARREIILRSRETFREQKFSRIFCEKK